MPDELTSNSRGIPPRNMRLELSTSKMLEPTADIPVRTTAGSMTSSGFPDDVSFSTFRVPTCPILKGRIHILYFTTKITEG